MRIFEVGLNAFCIIRWPKPMEAREWNVAVYMRMATIGH